jgi:hypothetical protein
MSQKCCDDCKVHYKLAMGGAPQGVMRVASQIWQVVFASQTLQVFCLAFCKKAQYVIIQVPRSCAEIEGNGECSVEDQLWNRWR